MKASYNLVHQITVVPRTQAFTVSLFFGRAPIPGGAAGLQIRQGLPAIPGGFDSHALPPFLFIPASARYSQVCL